MDKFRKKSVKPCESTEIDSDASKKSLSFTNADQHLEHCGYEDSKVCICDPIIKPNKSHQKIGQNISQSSDSFHSTILAGNAQCPSQKSSETSFHSAESSAIINKVITISDNESSTCNIKKLCKNYVEPRENIESLSDTSCTSSSVLDQDIGIKSVEQTNSSISVQSDVDLNKAQSLFDSSNTYNCDANHNINNEMSTSNATAEDENLHYLLGNSVTTEYEELPKFLRSFSTLSQKENDETSREVTRRLTKSFYQDPQEFAKRLMTIIEESEANYELEHTAISINKMASVFRKMCKYVEDESIPSLYEKVSPARHEISENVDIQVGNKSMKDNLALRAISTPTNLEKSKRGFDPRISPLDQKKYIHKNQSSPLYVSTLTRNIGPLKTPTKSSSPKSTSGLSHSHNDSSFTYWEKKFEARPSKKSKSTMPKLTDEELESIAETEEQLRRLQIDSPQHPLYKTEINIYNVHCDHVKPPDESKTLKNIASVSPNIRLDDNSDDMTESILNELAEKRKRCLETEQTIRQIDAESSELYNSPFTSESEESNKILEFLNSLRYSTDYKNFLNPDKIKSAHEYHDDSGIDSRSLSQTPCNTRKAEENQHFNVTMRKLPKTLTPQKKSPVIETYQNRLSRRNVKSTKSRPYIKSPALMSRRAAISNSVVKAISPIKGSSCESSLSTSAQKTPNTLRILKSVVCTPRLKSSTLKIDQPNTTRVKTQLTTKKSQGTNKSSIPTVYVTSSTPLRTPSKKKEILQTPKKKDSNTPMMISSTSGKFFNTPNKTPLPKIRPKPTTFFSVVDGVRKPVLASQTLTQFYSPGEVKSPIAEYVNGTDPTLVQNIRGRKNENLLTPKGDKRVSRLKFQLSAKKNTKESNKNPIYNSEVDSLSDNNDENISDNVYNHPKISYRLPSTVHEIKAEPVTSRGARAKRLMEAKNSRVVIQHAGRAMPQIRNVEPLDLSIYVTKAANKKKFVFRSKATKN